MGPRVSLGVTYVPDICISLSEASHRGRPHVDGKRSRLLPCQGRLLVTQQRVGLPQGDEYLGAIVNVQLIPTFTDSVLVHLSTC
jgi:hypothetical protein